jgi:hypothetical protein
LNTFYLPGNLFLALLKASQTLPKLATLALHENKISPILTLAALPIGLPKAPLIPVWSLSEKGLRNKLLPAPAHDNILLILKVCQGCFLQRKWKPSFPHLAIKYLLAAILAASKASEESYSFSQETI